ncbi:Phage protein D [Nakamurella panacisegetis]|uniref:Phage protein D n=1 Tax=Nakamurella panacisegetis TaxID=1090615 RepID=A0A1H0T8K6_9ACTN|nr:VgrG-related protein [Nakamurella panacisegetis]SDP50185.1 Phage protein D [Nakamurella panacisegetis]
MPTSTSFAVEIGGSPLPDDVRARLVSAVVDDSRLLPDLFLLRFRDPDHIVLAKAGAKIGAKVKISVEVAGGRGATGLLDGEITAVETDFDSTGTFTVIRGYDQSHRLFRGRGTHTYRQVTAADVAAAVAKRAGLRSGRMDPTSTVYEHLTQSGITDWEFLQSLAREVGVEVSVTDGALDFAKPTSASTAPVGTARPTEDPLVLQQGVDLLRFRAVVTSAEQVSQVQVRGWDLATKKALVSTAPARTTSADLPGANPAKLAETFGSPVLVSTDTPYRSQAEVDAAATAMAEQVAGSFAEFDGVARGNPQLVAGQAISVANIGEPFDGKYTITTSRHRYDPVTGYTTSFAVTGRQERSLLGLTGAGATGTGAGLAGPMVALVSDNHDPQAQGRVRLSMPWLSDDYTSDWARTVQAGAGKDRGGMVVPEVGDEVLVLFEQNDIRRPYVVGGLFNGVDTPRVGGGDAVDANSGRVNRRSTVSRRGHRIDLFDDDGRVEGITLAVAGDGLKLTLDAVGTAVTVHSDGTVRVEGKKGIVIDAASAKLELKGGEIAVRASTGLSLESSGGGVTVKAGGALALTGTTAKLEGSTTTEVKGGALCSVSATLVKIN